MWMVSRPKMHANLATAIAWGIVEIKKKYFQE